MKLQYFSLLTHIYIISNACAQTWLKIPATCGAASSNYNNDFHCSKAVDGGMKLFQRNEWSTVQNQGINSWIRLDFDQSYPVQYIRMMQRPFQGEQFKDFILTFEDGTTQTGRLSRRNGNSNNDIKGRWWDEYVVNGVESSWVRIEMTSVYQMNFNGFAEIEVYTGQSFNPCPAYYTLLDDSCYIINQNQTWSRDDAQLHCESREGHLVDLKTQTEVDKVRNWIDAAWGSDKSFWIGGMKINEEWKWSNGDVITTFPTEQPSNDASHVYTILTSSGSGPRSSAAAPLYLICEADAVFDDSEDPEYFKIQHGKKLEGQAIFSFDAVSLTHCVTHCKMIGTCQSVNFDHVTRKCDVNTNTASGSPGDVINTMESSYADYILN